MNVGKPQKYDDEFYIQLIDSYYLQKCNGNISAIKSTQIAQYAQSLGYTNLKEYDIRRNKAAKNHIKTLKERNVTQPNDIRAIFYSTLDPTDFLHKNNTPAKLKKALMQLDTQNKIQYDNFISLININEQLHKKKNVITTEVENIKIELNQLMLKLTSALEANNKLVIENKYLHDTLTTYLPKDVYSKIVCQCTSDKDQSFTEEALISLHQDINNLTEILQKCNMELTDSTLDEFESFLDQLESKEKTNE